jgi:hypothetical protein
MLSFHSQIGCPNPKSRVLTPFVIMTRQGFWIFINFIPTKALLITLTYRGSLREDVSEELWPSDPMLKRSDPIETRKLYTSLKNVVSLEKCLDFPHFKPFGPHEIQIFCIDSQILDVCKGLWCSYPILQSGNRTQNFVYWPISSKWLG